MGTELYIVPDEVPDGLATLPEAGAVTTKVMGKGLDIGGGCISAGECRHYREGVEGTLICAGGIGGSLRYDCSGCAPEIIRGEHASDTRLMILEKTCNPP